MRNRISRKQNVEGKIPLKKKGLLTSPILLILAAFVGMNKYKQTKNLNKYIQQIKENTNHVSRAIILGDSVAKGYGSPDGGITNYLKEHLEKKFGEVTVTNEGILHLTSHGLLQKMVREKAYDEQIRESNLVFINIGGNDLLQHYHREGPQAVVKNFFKVRSEYIKNLQQIIDHINKINPHITIVVNNLYISLEDNYQLFGLTSVFIDYWNAGMNKLPVVHVKTKEISKKEDLWADIVHPNQAGYKELSNLIIKSVNTLLGEET